MAISGQSVWPVWSEILIALGFVYQSHPEMLPGDPEESQLISKSHYHRGELEQHKYRAIFGDQICQCIILPILVVIAYSKPT